MGKKKCIIDNEQGSAIVLAMLILAVLTILGVSSTNTSTIELQIVRNERIYQQNFYYADSAAMEAAQKIENATSDELDDRNFTTFFWLKKGDNLPDMSNISNWVLNTNSVKTDSTFAGSELSVQEIGIARDSSLDMNAISNLYEYVVWGYDDSNKGHVLIMIGYKKRH